MFSVDAYCVYMLQYLYTTFTPFYIIFSIACEYPIVKVSKSPNEMFLS